MMKTALLAAAAAMAPTALAGNYLIGSGIYDITGEASEGGFMGYAVLEQIGTGIHFRQRSRAFIMVDPDTDERAVYVSIDFTMGFQMMKLDVVDRLKGRFGDMYTFDNVIISGTHTHSAPGGVGGTVLVDITTLGHNRENFNAIVEGIVESIQIAHDKLAPGDISASVGLVDEAMINRSPFSYEFNPEEEREQYKDMVDKEMTLLKFTLDDGTDIGMVNWFGIHQVSMNNTNTLVSGDNKGYASLLFEQAMNPGALPGKGDFVAAFGQAAEGDNSPNTDGPKCPDGNPCDYQTSTCDDGLVQNCIARGPGKDMDESTMIIGEKQYEEAMRLFNSPDQTLLRGSVGSRHKWADMQSQSVRAEWATTGRNESTCQAAMGYAFAAGTVDGPGAFDFRQGTNNSNPFWDLVSGLLGVPSEETKACQAPKPILLPVGLRGGLIGEIEWVPYILPIQIVKVGQLYMVAVPGEFSTMAGRRLRAQVRAGLPAGERDDAIIVIAGLANSYAHYTVTYEEYQAQRYEGGSTLYGPHTFAAFQQNYDEVLTALVRGLPLEAGEEPIDMRNRTFTLQPPVLQDTVPAGVSFGDRVQDVETEYAVGDIVTASFWGASLRNDLLTERTFLTVEMQNPQGGWDVVADDGCWETKFHWERVEGEDYQSHVTVEWDSAGAPQGIYRIQTFGVSKGLFGNKTPFSGTSSEFKLGL